VSALIESLEKLIKQSTEALGPDAESTLMLQQQLAAALAEQEKSRKVFWMQAVETKPEKKG
jgi:hypothetical protein